MTKLSLSELVLDRPTKLVNTTRRQIPTVALVYTAVFKFCFFVALSSTFKCKVVMSTLTSERMNLLGQHLALLPRTLSPKDSKMKNAANATAMPIYLREPVKNVLADFFR